LIVSELEEVTREFYRRVGQGEVDGVIELLSDQVTWTVPGPTAIPYAGTFLGKEGVAEFFRILLAHEDLQSFVPNEFVIDDARGVVCVLGAETAVAIATGRKFSTKWAEIFRVSNGLITAFEEHIDTFALAEAYTMT